MTPAARVQAAVEVMDEILDGSAAEAALLRWARQSRFAGSKDRRAIRDLVFGALRQKLSSAAIGGSNSGRGILLGYVAQSEGFDPEELFSGTGYGPSALSSAEREILGNPPSLSKSEALDLQEWLIPLAERALGDDLAATAKVMKARAPTFLRVNTAKESVDRVLEVLRADKYAAKKHALSDTAILVEGHPGTLSNHKLYQDGIFEFQDTASQALVDFLSPFQGKSALDFCAGGGGKSLALAAQGANVLASDINFDRMKDLPARAARAGVDIKLSRSDQLSGEYDLVLCDAPCSGSGAWRRQPDAKWKLTQSKLEKLTLTQLEVLENAKRFVSETGILAYATCSFLKEENEDVVNRFCKANSDWRCSAVRNFSILEGGDGFFVATLTQDGDSP